ncbi:aldehyde dehydrogenase family protein [Paraburkholderia sp. HD33-4]|uniref:aldehyde dehydrogenase family protein n=1 Tax=Paraburkholderia sp. HD33-4 TaxID=2883242 RepID=UPI001F231404|nr:aldehyde dehydrogenase family protein [Paraburkholderia sp. HD33-4]
MRYLDHFYIDGKFVPALDRTRRPVINPATLEPVGEIAMGTQADTDAAVNAARRAFESFSKSDVRFRLEMLRRIAALFEKRREDFARLMTLEMGTPISFSRSAQVEGSLAHIQNGIEILQRFEFEKKQGKTTLVLEPAGVCGLITPWNFPVLQIITKLIPALAVGCTVVLKPSEYSPLSAISLAELLHDADVPAGVFNLINGDGATVGAAMSAHPGLDMISFTGSTRAGILVAKAAAETVKRVHQELGGNSANIILPDADIRTAVKAGVHAAYRNAGQSCTAPGRMLVHRSRYEEAIEIARDAAEHFRCGDIFDEATLLGPVVNEAQYTRGKELIASALEEGATLVTGGADLPAGIETGYFIQPTVFANVTRNMRIAKDETFAPIVSLIAYDDVDEAVDIANDTPYGLAGYVQGSDESASKVASQLRVGQVQINQPQWDPSAPFGGFKQSGNGRECGESGFEAYLEIKAILKS